MTAPYKSQRKEAWLEKTPTLVAYCAGFFDGEGTIGFPGPVYQHSILLGVCQRVLEPIELFQGLFGGSIYIPVGRLEGTTQSSNGHTFPRGDVTYKWQITGLANGIEILNDFIPYLTVKRQQAQLALEWCSQAPGGNGSTVNYDLRKRREEIITTIKSLKRPWIQGGDAK